MGILNIFKKSPPPTPAQVVKTKVLVVDDEQYLRDFYQELLTQEGYDVTTAVDGQKALEAVMTNPPQVILLDIMMPVLDGFGYCERIRSDSGAQRMPIIVQTALGDREDKLRALSCGADDFINKPIDREELILRVHVHLERYFMFQDNDEMFWTKHNISTRPNPTIPSA